MEMDDEEDPWGEEPDWAQSTTERDDTGPKDRTTDGLSFEFGAQHILFLIDTSPSMFLPCVQLRNDDDEDDNDTDEDDNDDGNHNNNVSTKPSSLITPFDAALIACERLLLLRVHYASSTRSSKRDGVGIMLYGAPPSIGVPPTLAKSLCRADENTNENERTGPSGSDDANNNSYVKLEHGGGDASDIGDDEEDDEDDQEDDHRHKILSPIPLIDIEPPGIRQIQTVRSYLLPQHYGAGANGGHGTGRKVDVQTELYPQSNGTTKNENEGGSEDTVDGDLSICQLRVALYEASKAFGNARCVKKISATSQQPPDTKTCWIFTNRDDPTNGNTEEKQQTITAAKDVVDNGLDIRVWPLPVPAAASSRHRSVVASPSLTAYPASSPTVTFDRTLLFNHIATVQDGEEPSLPVPTTPNTASCGIAESQQSLGGGAYFDIHSLLEQIATHWKRVRKVQTIPMLLPDWNVPSTSPSMSSSSSNPTSYPGIALDLYQTTVIRRKPIPVVISSRTSKRTNRSTQILCKDTGEIIEPKRIRYYTEFGTERVPITQEEVAAIRRGSNANPESASLVLLGFKLLPSEISLLSLVDKSIFAYPNEDAIHGSRRAFTALHTSMIKKGVMGIGELLLRVTASSRLVAIVPQEEERIVEDDDTGVAISKQVAPPGFNLVPLAFEDDVRATPHNNHPADDGTIEATVDLIQNQIISGGITLGESFPNPVLKSFWGYMESVSLGMPLREDELDGADDTELNVEGILSAAGEQIKALQLRLPEDTVEEKQQRKRKAKEEVPDETGIDWLKCYESGEISDCKVDELKAYLRSVGEKVGGRKQDIIDRVLQHIEGCLSNEVDDTKPMHVKAFLGEGTV